MIAFVVFSLFASLLVYAVGRKDAARDPKLTVCLILLLAAFPLLSVAMPKFSLLPATEASTPGGDFPWLGILFGIWLAGFVFQLARLVFAVKCLSRWRKLSHETDRKNGISIRLLDGLESPVAAGIFHKLIFVPHDWHLWEENRREMVIAHEIAHHRRNDPFWRLCVELVCAVHWYHPLVHWMSKRYIIQCEYACDESVIRSGANPRAYAHTLCDVAQKKAAPTFAFAMADKSSLELRVRRISESGNRRKSLAVAVAAITGLLSALALSAIGSEKPKGITPDAAEIQLRLTANPFPGE
ncbi:M56 family metallopeptidase [Luteolibacter sp. AS25]|uniref:M56 family metallopeptidase n=1 Tax=Luteolibacter sp. AS25 TaxID=3135776 RepID=UPI00398BA785